MQRRQMHEVGTPPPAAAMATVPTTAAHQSRLARAAQQRQSAMGTRRTAPVQRLAAGPPSTEHPVARAHPTTARRWQELKTPSPPRAPQTEDRPPSGVEGPALAASLSQETRCQRQSPERRRRRGRPRGWPQRLSRRTASTPSCLGQCDEGERFRLGCSPAAPRESGFAAAAASTPRGWRTGSRPRLREAAWSRAPRRATRSRPQPWSAWQSPSRSPWRKSPHHHSPRQPWLNQ